MKKRINLLIIITLLILLIFVFIIYFKQPTIIFENKSKVQTESTLKTFSNEGITIKEINLSTLRDSCLK
ncbi:hypothetical protein [Clostridium septicum]|uniref:Uncharacterized protein n=1 Tax=Clostridium septicum TaxID=1504 RepID=A0A9N7PKC8_CLOSE|nr:hypothetical protein [Clostridium septicum]AYE35565.1 hypothetical protein CP523_14625 [Clostridium septicum]QAS60951.1 hypothetical protein EI377_09590 [Clostridium septicum]UEC19772.1 hypothetical protein LK444_10120 [Clostridium septicum]USS02168.1 hypothetical protein NH397_07050 [Clostridium septicum]WLF70743.1 hypothetical protein Q6375_07135 [Clostridium septicum]